MTFLTIIVIALIAIILYLYFRPRREKPAVNLPYIEALLAELEGNIDQAIKKYKEALNIDTNLIDGYIRLGNLYKKKNDISRAIKIHQSLTVRPTLKKDTEKKIYYALAQDYLDLNRPNKAVSFLKEILNIDKNEKPAFEKLLHIYEDLQNFQDCIAVIEEYASETDDGRRRAYYYAALANSKLNESGEDREALEKEALALFKKALKIKPDSLATLYSIAEFYRNKGEFKKAREYYLKIAQLHPKWTFLIIENFEKVAFETGTFDEIIPLYEKIFKADPKNFTVGFALANLYEKKNEKELAKEIYYKISELYPKSLLPKLLLTSLMGDTKSVRKELNEVIKLVTENKFVCTNCGMSTNKFIFLCPKCHSVESFLPHC
ncbi:MAG: tetratricopeptide repeat protein [candidate division WOR-3 bacterium]